MKTVEQLENLITNTRYMRYGSQAMLGVIADILLEILRELKKKTEPKEPK